MTTHPARPASRFVDVQLNGDYNTRTACVGEMAVTEVVTRHTPDADWVYQRYTSADRGNFNAPVHGHGELPLTDEHAALTLAMWAAEGENQP